MKRNEKIISYSGIIGEELGLTLRNKEFNYGKSIGRADNYCVLNDWIIIIEMEFSQRHPEMNVMKAWPYLETNPKSKILMIQHLMDEKSVSPNRIELCHWIANKMEAQVKGRFFYKLLINELNEKSLNEIKKQMRKLGIL
jgi:hypothetical protein